MTKTLRKVQPAHKSDKITVSQAARAWKKVEARAANAASGRASAPSRVPNSVSAGRVAPGAKVAAEKIRS